MWSEIEELVRLEARPVGLTLEFVQDFAGLYEFPSSSSLLAVLTESR